MKDANDVNIVNLAKIALEFYANAENYVGDTSKIILDGGSQAKFALDNIKHMLDVLIECEMEYQKLVEMDDDELLNFNLNNQ